MYRTEYLRQCAETLRTSCATSTITTKTATITMTHGLGILPASQDRGAVDYSDERGNSLTLLVPESAAPTRRWRTKARQTYTHWCCEEASVLKVFATDCSRTIWRLRFCSLWCTTSTTLEPRVLAIRLLGTYSEIRDIDPGCSSDKCAGTYRELKGHSFNG